MLSFAAACASSVVPPAHDLMLVQESRADTALRQNACHVVVANVNDAEGVRQIEGFVATSGCRVFVYDLRGCERMPVGTTCLSMGANGNEFRAYLHHVVHHWTSLPDWLIMMSTPLWQRQRSHHLRLALDIARGGATSQFPEGSFWCPAPPFSSLRW